MKKIVIKGVVIFFVWGFLEEIHVGFWIVIGLLLIYFGERFAGLIEIGEDALHFALLFGGEGVELAQIALYMHELNLYQWF